MKPVDVYKSAKELKVTEQERAELIESIPYFLALEPGEFRMVDWSNCICGHIAKRNGRDPLDEYHHYSGALGRLYGVNGQAWTELGYSATAASPVDAARAIVAFLSGA